MRKYNGGNEGFTPLASQNAQWMFLYQCGNVDLGRNMVLHSINWATIIGDQSWNWENLRHLPKPGDLILHQISIREGVRGVNKIMSYIDENMERVPNECAYSTEDILKRPNFKVSIHDTHVKILDDVSTRLINAEKILLFSGAGTQNHLQEHDILPVVHDLPGIGSNLIDHRVPWSEGAAFCRSDVPMLSPSGKFPQKCYSSPSPDLEVFTTVLALAYKEHARAGCKHQRCTSCLSVTTVEQRKHYIMKSKSPWDVPIISQAHRLCLKLARTEPLESRVDWNYKGGDVENLDMALDGKMDEEL
ncbi:hypothetical protein F5050DRAFT_1905742 [Lentinula boryana]|uniref:Glucose-methanol-choline oxidoreductase N-terminal domain-containing protein n=1 Tax=Lentinula boryana TaxID=40481 RepID=A0ABQ8PZ47_9AGAR|nr:hypothetical protein F5050DRAFT_1905742 [Lentinula boryana]